MEVETLIRTAIHENRNSLTEHEAKELLKSYSIPVVQEIVATTVDDVCLQATQLGFPIAVKGLGAQLTHKTEMGVVRLNLSTIEDVREAANEIQENAGDKLEGFLVQPMIQGRREFVAGVFRDPTFGPMVMFGLGGVLTEALNDVAFGMAPLDEKQADLMIDQIKAQKLLREFRGEKAVDRDALKQTLIGLSRIVAEHPEISEIDINPLLVQATGNITAVDALVVLGEKQHFTERPSIQPEQLARLFYPRNIVFIGASSKFGKWGHNLPSNAIAAGFEGEIHLVNPKGGEIIGKQAYTSVLDLPDKVDLAFVTIPAKYVFDLLPQLAEKKIRNVVMISSDFGETGEEGKKREEQLVEDATRLGLLILGPNTMGICNPHTHLFCMPTHVRPRAGSTTLVAQSGNMGTQLLAFAEKEGVGIRAFSGSGNEAMISIEDYMDSFEVDPLTRTVVLYLESVKNGPRFYESALRVGKKKPVVILKGGRSKVGSLAASSHTGAMAQDSRVFSAVCKQAGIVEVNQPMDLLDVSACFASLPLPKGPRIGIMTLGGGWGVVTADLCSENGLQVPKLDQQIVERLDTMLPAFWSRANPVDLVGEHDPSLPITVVEELLKWDGCDAVINLGIHGFRILTAQMFDSIEKCDPAYPKEFIDTLRQQIMNAEDHYIERMAQLMEKYQKPVVGVSLLSDEHSKTVYQIPDCQYNSVFFLTPERAVKSLAKMWRYANWRNTFSN